MKLKNNAIAIALVVSMCLLLFACGKKEEEKPVDPQKILDEMSSTPVPTQKPTQAPTPEPTLTPEPTPTADPYTYEDLLASVYGYTNNRSDESLANIELACEKLNGWKILAGDTFSFNDAIGITTEENGFKKAEVYASYEDEEIYQYGGGVNIVASTVYCAGLYGVLTPVERYQHHFYLTANGYLVWGSDAYVCNDGENDTVDMKLLNPYSYPVQIKAWLDKDAEKVHIELYGTNPNGLRGEPVHSLTSYYLEAADWVNDRFTNEETRKVYDSKGFLREDDLHEFDKSYDGDVYYYRHVQDYVW